MEGFRKYSGLLPEETIKIGQLDWESRMREWIQAGKVFVVENWRSEIHLQATYDLLGDSTYQCRPQPGPMPGMLFYPEIRN